MNPKAPKDAAMPSEPDGLVGGRRPSGGLSDSDEARLRPLFDATVEPPAGPTLTKLLARAADVPARARRTPLWLPRWAWKPTAAGLVVASGALGAALFNTPIDTPEPSEPAVGARHMPSAPEPAAAVSVTEPPRLPAAAAAVETDLEPELETAELVAADAAWDSEADEEETLDALYGPPADENLDAWLYATSALLEGGG